MEYTAFTDIAFNPEKAKNCQACAAAVYVSLKKSGMLAEALEDQKAFLQIVYGIDSREKEKGASNTNEQITMWWTPNFQCAVVQCPYPWFKPS